MEDEYVIRSVGLYVRDQLKYEQTRARPEYCRRLWACSCCGTQQS
jgi:hypothetical protein